MVSERLNKVILRELDVYDFDMNDGAAANKLPGWDSSSCNRILTAVETEYDVRFRTMEVLRLRNVGELQGLLNRNCP